MEKEGSFCTIPHHSNHASSTRLAGLPLAKPTQFFFLAEMSGQRHKLLQPRQLANCGKVMKDGTTLTGGEKEGEWDRTHPPFSSTHTH